MYTYNKFGSRAPTIQSTQTEALDIKLDYNNNYIHTGIKPISYIRNVINPNEGYPKLQKLHQLKKFQIQKHALQPYGFRCKTDQMVSTIENWIDFGIKFDVIMIGALVENQFILPILNSIPKLCSKPGFLFIWATTNKIYELTDLLNNENFNKKFRRSEELIFLPIDKSSPYYPHDDSGLFEKQQWHCWMCITGTVRRSTDNHLIHCNIDTDLHIETIGSNAVPDSIYKVAENFSNSNRRLHIISNEIGMNHYVKLRPGWVIMSPDVLLNNFDPLKYTDELYTKSMVKRHDNKDLFLVEITNEIEQLRPKTPK